MWVPELAAELMRGNSHEWQGWSLEIPPFPVGKQWSLVGRQTSGGR